jgi:hypothetical protein
MFAALSENTQWFKDRMKAFIAIAPVVQLKNCGSQKIQKIAKDKNAYNAIKLGGLEILPYANADNPLKSAIADSFLGASVSLMAVQEISDKDSSLVSKRAWSNF